MSSGKSFRYSKKCRSWDESGIGLFWDHPGIGLAIGHFHCVKRVQIRSFFWSVFSPNAGKCRPEKTPYLDTFHAVVLLAYYGNFQNLLNYKPTTFYG